MFSENSEPLATC